MSEQRKRHEVTGDRIMQMSIVEMVAMVGYLTDQPCGDAVVASLQASIDSVCDEEPTEGHIAALRGSA